MTAESQSDATRLSLISRARDHDSVAWSELVDLYGPLVAYWCTRCGLKADLVPDCVQEVFASVARSIGTYRAQRSSGAFRSWLWTITHNKIKDDYRRRKNGPEGQGGSSALLKLSELPCTDDIPDDEPTDAEQISELVARGLEQVRQEFEHRTWDIFRRSVIDQIATSIVAKEFCVTPASVRQTRSRILRRLRQQLGDLDS